MVKILPDVSSRSAGKNLHVIMNQFIKFTSYFLFLVDPFLTAGLFFMYN